MGRDRKLIFGVFFRIFELNFRHLAKVGVRHLGRDRTQKWEMHTSLVWPMRCALSCACASIVGFQSES